MLVNWLRSMTAMGLVVLATGTAAAQAPETALEAAAAMERVMVSAIARAEKSVVAIARVRKEAAAEKFAHGVPSRSVRPPACSVPSPQAHRCGLHPQRVCLGGRCGSPRADSHRLSRAG